ncbi:DNA adenine methylase [Sphingobium sp. TomTYG45]
MGSKRAMLKNGLGSAIEAELEHCSRFVDMFTGSGSVAIHVATRWPVPVWAGDLQNFAVALADAVIGRTEPLSGAPILDWIADAVKMAQADPDFKRLSKAQRACENEATPKNVNAARALCAELQRGPLSRAYGGYYYGPLQALLLDCLRQQLPVDPALRKVGLGGLIAAASMCAASPGHTAQPFQPTDTARKYISEAWAKDPVRLTMEVCNSLATQQAKNLGTVSVVDAVEMAQSLQPGDIAFIDPPYSAVHYSRFYHVLEGICTQYDGEVSGTGRYPPQAHRPRSDFSMKGTTEAAFRSLFKGVSESGARAIVTFPAGAASNGVSGEDVLGIAEEFFHVEQRSVTGRFSTLGGNKINRSARLPSDELILRLRPR